MERKPTWQPDDLCSHNKFPCWKSFSLGGLAAAIMIPAGIALGVIVVLEFLQP